MLFKIKKIESPLCYLCGKEPETLEHFLFYCPRVQMIGNYITLTRPFDIKDVLFGMESQEHYNKLGNYIILESKYFLYLCKLNNKHDKPLSLKSLLAAKIKRTYQIEPFLVRQKDLLNYHYKKWEPLLPIISC